VYEVVEQPSMITLCYHYTNIEYQPTPVTHLYQLYFKQNTRENYVDFWPSYLVRRAWSQPLTFQTLANTVT